MTHVFIVNDKTFNIHLKYMFAGTTGDTPVFLFDTNYKNPKSSDEGLTASAERKNISMIADISKIEKDDKIIFYKRKGQKGEGTFFGVFKAKSAAFYDANNNSETYKFDELGCDLHYRVLIEPDEVYECGVTEYDAIDSLNGVNHPAEMCWSLLYRKLEAERGCTMITDYESEVLVGKIKNIKGNKILRSNGYSFDFENNKIVSTTINNTYDKKEIFDFGSKIEDRMYYKYLNGHKFEAYLQAYITQKVRTGLLDLSFVVNGQDKNFWVGYELICSFGKRRIDILMIDIINNNVNLSIYELKAIEAYDDIYTYQLPKYVNWVDDYIRPIYKKRNMNVFIKPYIVSFESQDKTKENKYICELKNHGMGYIDYFFDKNGKIKFTNKLTV